MANSKLTEAKISKNDEFYTQYQDIEKEMNSYLEYNEDVFKDKVILLPCDDPEWSNFTKYFAQNFDRFGIKKLISTSFAPESKTFKTPYQYTLFETESPIFDKEKTQTHGKIFTLEKDKTGDGKIDVKDIEWEYLDGDGDFRSDEIKKLRDEADIIITNPPFSLFKEFLAWIMEGQKKFVIIGNMNCITYKEVFPLVKENMIWLGVPFPGGNAYFRPAIQGDYASGVYNEETNLVKFRNCIWLTNIDHGRRHEPLPLMTLNDNLRYTKHKELQGRKEYEHYENYDAIEVPFTDAIPSDYNGIMGVPISFLDKYCPEQYEILGMCENEDLYHLKTKFYNREECKGAYYDKFHKKGSYDLNASGVVIRNGLREKVYQRILIRKR